MKPNYYTDNIITVAVCIFQQYLLNWHKNDTFLYIFFDMSDQINHATKFQKPRVQLAL